MASRTMSRLTNVTTAEKIVAKVAEQATHSQLLRAFASLTHQMHAADADYATILRQHRDIVETEIITRMES